MLRTRSRPGIPRPPLAAIAALLLAACARAPERLDAVSTAHGATVSAFHAETVLADEWQNLVLRGATDYRMTVRDGEVAIRAEGRRSASGLVRALEVDPARCRTLAWSWAVERLQASADLEHRRSDDVAAAVYLMFGDPGFLADPEPVPTLRYVWTSSRHEVGSVIDSPYMPGIVKSLVARNDPPSPGWAHERRNVLEDYRRAFGQAPEDLIHAVALFVDNDQTDEPVVSYFRAGHFECSPQRL